LVFQDAQLFPHLTVKQNLLFGRWFAPRNARTVLFASLIETLGIGHLLKRKPARLSGGEEQRVAIGRALLASPEILLMDEPLASLDTERKLEILLLIESLRDDLHIPIVYVSHSSDEVARLASRVIVLENGHVVAAGSVEDVFGPGLSATGMSRFARSSVVTGKLASVDPDYGLTEIFHPAGTIWLTGRAGPVGGEARIVIKPTDITLSKKRVESLSVRTTLAGRVSDIETDGAFAGISVDLDGHGRLFALATRKAADELNLRSGDRVYALVKTVALDERAVASYRP
jgi:molybdate transport system ATP-binding protein